MTARHGWLALVLLVAGCGGGGSDGGGSNPPPAPPPNFSIGFSVTGLAGDGLVISGAGQTVPVDADGNFTLVSSIASGTAYNVSVQTHPTGPQQYCAVSNGSGTVGGNVTNIAVSCMDGLVVQGQVTDAPIPGAIVTFTIGDLTFTTVADGNGFYELLIGSDDEDAVVIARARGAGGQAFVDFRGILGIFGGLHGLADGEVLNDSLLHAVNITNVSTARFILLTRFLNGQPPATAEELAEAEARLYTNDLINIAVAIKVIVDNPDFDLPDGFASIFDFASDIGAVRSFIVEANSAMSPTPFEQARTALLSDPSLVPGFSQETLASAYYLIPPTPEQLMAPMGHKLELDEGGVGTFLNTYLVGTLSATHTFEWAYTDGALTLTYDQPDPMDFPFGGNASTSQMRAAGLITDEESSRLTNAGVFFLSYYQYPVEDVFRALAASGDVIPVMVERSVRRVFRPWNLDEEGVIEPSDWYPPASIGGYEFQDVAAFDGFGFTEEQVVGEWAIYLHREYGPFSDPVIPEGRYIETFVADLVTFSANGTATAQFYEEPITWTVTQDGRLVMQLGEEWVQEVRMLELRGPVVGTFIEVYHEPTERRFGGNLFAVKRDTSFQPDASYFFTGATDFWTAYTGMWQAQYWDATGPNLEALYPTALFGLLFEADGDYGRGNFSWVQGGVTGSIAYWGTWVFDEEGFVFAERVDTQPAFYSTRSWWPVAEDADGFLYTVEEQQLLDSVSEEMRVFSPLRIGVHRKEPRLTSD